MSRDVPKPDDEAHGAESVQLLTSYQRDIYLYVRSLVIDPDQASEIVQNTNLLLWEKREEFKTVRNFRAWAFQIARYKVSEYRAQIKRKGLCFSDALIDQLALQAPQHAKVNADLVDELRRCITLLAAQDRELVGQRYTSLASCENIAKATGRPIRWVYNNLNRIRQELLECMARHAKARRER